MLYYYYDSILLVFFGIACEPHIPPLDPGCGKLIRLGRKEQKMTEEGLSGRAGISRRTLQKIERAAPKCEIG